MDVVERAAALGALLDVDLEHSFEQPGPADAGRRRWHGWVERVVGPVLIIVPFVLGLSTELAARNFYVAMGVVIVLVGLVTDYKGTET